MSQILLEESRFDPTRLYGVGAKWRGSIKGAGEVTYEFAKEIPSIPPTVISTRKEMNLPPAIWARTAFCNCPRLQIKENVVVSCDDNERLVLQSLIKPELGKLCLRQFCKDRMIFLVGGDEYWTESDAPEVEVSLLRPAIGTESDYNGNNDENIDSEVSRITSSKSSILLQNNSTVNTSLSMSMSVTPGPRNVASSPPPPFSSGNKIVSRPGSSSSSKNSYNNSDTKRSSAAASPIQNLITQSDGLSGTGLVSRLGPVDVFDPAAQSGAGKMSPKEESANQFVYAAAHGNFLELKKLIEDAEKSADLEREALLEQQNESSSTSSRPGSSTSNYTSSSASITIANARKRKTVEDIKPLITVDHSFATVGPHKGKNALMVASEMGRLRIVEWLLDERKADVSLESTEGYGVVYYACKKQNNVEILKQLLYHRADPKDGFPLTCARGDDRALEALLNWQTSANILDECIRQSAKNGHGKCLMLLLRLQRYKNNSVLTQALQLACVSGKSSAVTILLSHQADPFKKTGEHGLNALQLAEQYDHDKVLEVLRSYVPPKPPGRNILAEVNQNVKVM